MLFVAFSAHNASGTLPNSTLDLRNPSDFAPLRSSRWLNGIWFTSLVLSLIVAFLCILLKQWLEEYNGRILAPFPSVRQWARRRTFYFDGLTDWGVPVFIALLPILLHVALFLFLAGLGVFLLPLDSANAIWLLTLTGCLAVFYVVSTILPFARPDCPSSTPMIRLLRTPLRILGLHVLMRISSLAASPDTGIPLDEDADRNEALSSARQCPRQTLAQLAVASRRAAMFITSRIILLIPSKLKFNMMETYWTLHRQFAARTTSAARPSMLGRDFSDVEQERLEGRALHWLITSRSTAEVVIVGFQAIGALLPSSHIVADLQKVDDIEGLMVRSLNAVYLPDKSGNVCSPADIARSIRSAKCLFDPLHAYGIVRSAARNHFRDAVVNCLHYDLPFLGDLENVWADDTRRSRVLMRLASSPPSPHPDCRPHFLLSTAMQTLHNSGVSLSIWLQLCRMLPLDRDLPIRDFVHMTNTLLPTLCHDACPLQERHSDRDCSIQCSYELLSEVVNNRESLALREEDARAGIDIILRYCKGHTVIAKELWVPLENSQLLVLVGSTFFQSHTMAFFRSGLVSLVCNLQDMAHCIQRSRGLPMWTAEWGQAVHAIITRALGLSPRARPVVEEISFRIMHAIVTMFNVQDPAHHISLLSTDNIDHLPLCLLLGGKSSAWELLISLPLADRHGKWLDMLASLLAASLGLAARAGKEVDAEFDTFIKSSYLVKRLLSLQDKSWTNLPPRITDEFLALVQHCNEVRSDWLEAVLQNALGSQDLECSRSARNAINTLRTVAARQGRCRKCHDARSTHVESAVGRLRLHVRNATQPRLSFAEARARWLGEARLRNDYDRGADPV